MPSKADLNDPPEEATRPLALGASTGTLRLEMVKCGKTHCKKCAADKGHGPYWYLYFRRNGKLTSGYIGKMIRQP